VSEAGQHRYGAGSGTERVAAFSDGVFAIAVTLLVLDLKLRDLPPHASNAELAQALIDTAPQIFTYVLSFLVVGLYWITHHRLFAFIKRYDSRLLWLNVLALLCVAFLPFPSSVMGEYGNRPVAVMLFAATLAATGLAQTLIWWYASHGWRLVDRDLEPELIRYVMLRGLIAVAVFLLSIPVALIDTTLAQLSWLLIIPGLAVLTRRYSRADLEEGAATAGSDSSG
jgi:uncharacterized membrane protein